MPTTQNTLRIDLHGMYVDDAMELLRERVERAPSFRRLRKTRLRTSFLTLRLTTCECPTLRDFVAYMGLFAFRASSLFEAAQGIMFKKI